MTSPSETPRVSVLIVNYNGLHHLRECLDSLLAQTYPNLEVVLVDNGSSDGSTDFVAANFPSVKIVRSESNLGFAGGNNFGAKHCTGEFVYFLNNDTRADRDAVAALMRAREEHSEYSIFGSLLVNYDDPSKVDSAGDTFYWMGLPFSFTGYPVGMFGRPRPVASAKGAAVLFPKALLDRLGWYDEDFFLIYEDVDLALRARHAGHQVLLAPDSRIHHKGSASLGGGASPLTVFYAARNYPLVVLKNFPLPVLLRFLPGFFFGELSLLRTADDNRCLGDFLRGSLAFLGLAPKFLFKRWKIMRESRLSGMAFGPLFRKNMLVEQRAFYQGNYDIPL